MDWLANLIIVAVLGWPLLSLAWAALWGYLGWRSGRDGWDARLGLMAGLFLGPIGWGLAVLWSRRPVPCPACGARIPPDAALCPMCAAEQPVALGATRPRCGGCGTRLIARANVCHACGASALDAQFDAVLDAARRRRRRVDVGAGVIAAAAALAGGALWVNKTNALARASSVPAGLVGAWTMSVRDPGSTAVVNMLFEDDSTFRGVFGGESLFGGVVIEAAGRYSVKNGRLLTHSLHVTNTRGDIIGRKLLDTGSGPEMPFQAAAYEMDFDEEGHLLLTDKAGTLTVWRRGSADVDAVLRVNKPFAAAGAGARKSRTNRGRPK